MTNNAALTPEDLRKIDDQAFEKWLAANPGGTFSQYSMTQVAARIRSGKPHESLGPRLKTDEDWWQAGRKMFDGVLNAYAVPETAKVCDYGCGSLRVGAHFIKRQPPHSFVGLDVTEDFIEYGKEIIGSEILEDKKPIFGSIANGIEAAVNLNVDVLYATLVAHHVHPDEKPAFFENIKRIAHKPGAVIIYNVYLAPERLRYQRSGWAWREEDYLEGMAPLKLIAKEHRGNTERSGHTIGSYMLAFQRPLD